MAQTNSGSTFMQIERVPSDALSQIIDNYRYSVGGYAKFLGTLHPVMDELPARDEQAIAARTQDALAKFRKNATREEFAELISVLRRMAPEKGRSSGPEVPGGESAPGEAPPAHSTDANGEITITMSPNVGGVLFEILKAVRKHTTAPQHREILYRGVLTGLVGQFEVLVADLAHHYFRHAPGAIGGDDKIISARELLAFTSLESAKDFIISERVDDLLRGSAEDWAKFFEKRMKLDLRDSSPDWHRFVERIQRRHLIVHAGSRVSRRYLENVDKRLLDEYFKSPEVGDLVRLSSEYIERALDEFEGTGLVLGFAVWTKLHPDRAEIQASRLTDVVYESVCEGRWAVVRHIARWGARQSQFDASTRLVCQMNEWLALKRLGQFAECKGSVEQLDCSALSARFRMVRHALLDDHDSFFQELERGGAADMDELAWNEWPVFDEVRKESRFCIARDLHLPQTAKAPNAKAVNPHDGDIEAPETPVAHLSSDSKRVEESPTR